MAQAPSLDTIGAPIGVAGVQREPNTGQSTGFFNPCSTSALMHSGGSGAEIVSTPKTFSASNAA
jgi:hypothetical protein